MHMLICTFVVRILHKQFSHDLAKIIHVRMFSIPDILYGNLMMGEAASAAGGNPQFNQLQVTGV